MPSRCHAVCASRRAASCGACSASRDATTLTKPPNATAPKSVRETSGTSSLPPSRYIFPAVVALLDNPRSVRSQRWLPRSRGRGRVVAAQPRINLLPIDIDVVHPATGEMSESREQKEGGYIPIKRNNKTPVTKLKLHSLEGLPDAKFKLVFSSNKIKLWKQCTNGVFSEPITTDDTTFPANQETEVYVEGVTKSTTAKDVEVGVKVVIGSTESSSASIKLTVVQAEFPITVRAFIPYLWTEPDFISAFFVLVAGGDNRGLSLSEEARFRMRQQITITPYEDLHSNTDKFTDRLVDTADLSYSYDKNKAVPVSERGGKHGYSFISGVEAEKSGRPIINQSKTKFDFKSRVNPKTVKYYIAAGASDGALYVPDFTVPDIDWNFDLEVDCTNIVKPKITATGARDKFPAYEILTLTSDKKLKEIYYWRPPVEWQVGLSTLNSQENVTASLEVP
jgi:hypothetical protein